MFNWVSSFLDWINYANKCIYIFRWLIAWPALTSKSRIYWLLVYGAKVYQLLKSTLHVKEWILIESYFSKKSLWHLLSSKLLFSGAIFAKGKLMKFIDIQTNPKINTQVSMWPFSDAFFITDRIELQSLMTVADLHRQSLIEIPPPWGPWFWLGYVTYCTLHPIFGEPFE